MKTIFLMCLCLVFTSCAFEAIPEATPEGEKIKIIENSDDCKIINIVSGESDWGERVGQDLKYSLIEAKNKAAKLGADSIRIIGSEDVSTKAAFSQPGDTITVEALVCN